MDVEERRARRNACVEVIRSNDIRRWLQEQLKDIDALEAGEHHPAPKGGEPSFI